jgi:hypothetical protein
LFGEACKSTPPEDYTALFLEELKRLYLEVPNFALTWLQSPPGRFDPELYARIKGDPDEINHFGRRLVALEVGVIWHKKFMKRFFWTQGPQFRRNIDFFGREEGLTWCAASMACTAPITPKPTTGVSPQSFLTGCTIGTPGEAG